ncbi:MAG: lipid-binding SYLF domain-containing protein [Alphaproteobacteria bacterium]
MAKTAQAIDIKKYFYGLMAGTLAVLLLAGPALAKDKFEAQELVDSSRSAFMDLIDQGDNVTAKALLKEAKGVMIFPSVIKVGLVLGGEGGSGVMMTRAPNGTWSYPAFYHMASASFGLQIGGQQTRFLLILMTDEAVNRMLQGEAEIGGDLSAVIIEDGIDKELTTTTGRKAIYYIAETEAGLFAGASIEGSNIKFRKKTARNYYGERVTPQDILVNFKVSEEGAGALRSTVANHSR